MSLLGYGETLSIKRTGEKREMTVSIRELIEQSRTAPFDDVVTRDDYIEIEKLVGKEITIQNAYLFENDKGPGVSVLITVDGDMHYFTTHAVNIVKTFQNPEVQKILDGGDPIGAVIVQKKSKKTGRMYFCFDSE